MLRRSARMELMRILGLLASFRVHSALLVRSGQLFRIAKSSPRDSLSQLPFNQLTIQQTGGNIQE
jgi:hypothetical protein